MNTSPSLPSEPSAANASAPVRYHLRNLVTLKLLPIKRKTWDEANKVREASMKDANPIPLGIVARPV